MPSSLPFHSVVFLNYLVWLPYYYIICLPTLFFYTLSLCKLFTLPACLPVLFWGYSSVLCLSVSFSFTCLPPCSILSLLLCSLFLFQLFPLAVCLTCILRLLCRSFSFFNCLVCLPYVEAIPLHSVSLSASSIICLCAPFSPIALYSVSLSAFSIKLSALVLYHLSPSPFFPYYVSLAAFSIKLSPALFLYFLPLFGFLDYRTCLPPCPISLLHVSLPYSFIFGFFH